MHRRLRLSVACSIALLSCSVPAFAQDVPHDHSQMIMADDDGWELMQDGILYAEFNHQGGPRGGDELVAPNWWMGMAGRQLPRGRLTFTAMLSLDPATVGKDGYREIFQAGEALDGRPLIDRQHPHDLFMQLAAIWRVPLTSTTGLTLAGGPVGEPALGPVAFMHRASAADNPTAPLGHHSLDSTHIAFGVVTAAIDRGPWVLEASLFNAREPDENRWDIEFGRLDSFAARIWYRPHAEWEFQASSGRLNQPEALEPGVVVRSTASASWTRSTGTDISSVSVAYGRNDTDHGGRGALLVEGARRLGVHTWYSRFEIVQAETALLQSSAVLPPLAAETTSPVLALTVGGVRDVLRWNGFEAGLGADVNVYRVPADLQPMYSAHPISFRVFLRLRPPAGAMGRMWNMRMSQPMAGRQMNMAGGVAPGPGAAR